MGGVLSDSFGCMEKYMPGGSVDWTVGNCSRDVIGWNPKRKIGFGMIG